MEDYSFYSAILGLSSEWRISNVTVNDSTGIIELHIQHTNTNTVCCTGCGAVAVPAGTRMARCFQSRNRTLRFDIYVSLPLATCGQCGETEAQLPWQQSAYQCEWQENTGECNQL